MVHPRGVNRKTRARFSMPNSSIRMIQGFSRMPVLRVKNGPDKGKVLEVVNQPLTIGRDATESLQVLDQGASRRHAEIFKIGEMVFIRDLGSKNGTFVNDERIHEELLQLGDKVKIGTTLLAFEEGMKGEEEEQDRIVFSGVEALEATMEIDLHGGGGTFETGGEDSGWGNSLRTLYALAQAAATEQDEKALMEKVLSLTVEAVDADAGYIFVRDIDGRLVPRALLEKREEEGRKISRTIIKRVFKDGKSVLTSDAGSDTRFREHQSVVMKRLQSVICVPLTAFEKIRGVLYLHASRLDKGFTQQDLEFVTAIGVQTGAALANLQSAALQQKMMMGAVKSLIATYELRNPERRGHSGRVCIWSTAIANELGLPVHENRNLQLAALLHDVGKIVASERSSVQTGDSVFREQDHVLLGEEIIRNIEGMEGILPGIKHHHERADGSGYPDGLAGDEIPLIARIIGLADRFDHLSREMEGGIKAALVVVGKNEEGLFHPGVVEALLLSYRNGDLFAPPNLLLDQFETTVDDSQDGAT